MFRLPRTDSRGSSSLLLIQRGIIFGICSLLYVSVWARRGASLFGPLLDDQRQRLLVNGVAHGWTAGTMTVLDELIDVFNEHVVLVGVVDGSLETAQAHLKTRDAPWEKKNFFAQNNSKKKKKIVRACGCQCSNWKTICKGNVEKNLRSWYSRELTHTGKSTPRFFSKEDEVFYAPPPHPEFEHRTCV